MSSLTDTDATNMKFEYDPDKLSWLFKQPGKPVTVTQPSDSFHFWKQANPAKMSIRRTSGEVSYAAVLGEIYDNASLAWKQKSPLAYKDSSRIDFHRRKRARKKRHQGARWAQNKETLEKQELQIEIGRVGPPQKNWTDSKSSSETAHAVEYVTFPAFIESIKENYALEWQDETIVGRMDPMSTYKRTTRKIDLNFKVVAESFEEAEHNVYKVGLISRWLYPTYILPSTGMKTFLKNSDPRLLFRFLNLIRNSRAPYYGKGDTILTDGLTGRIEGFEVNWSDAIEEDLLTGLDEQHKYKPKKWGAGSDTSSNPPVIDMSSWQPTYAPKILNLSFSIVVHHTHYLGLIDGGGGTPQDRYLSAGGWAATKTNFIDRTGRITAADSWAHQAVQLGQFPSTPTKPGSVGLEEVKWTFDPDGKVTNSKVPPQMREMIEWDKKVSHAVPNYYLSDAALKTEDKKRSKDLIRKTQEIRALG